MQDQAMADFHKLAATGRKMSNGRMFFWDARGVYVGQTFGLRPHRNAVAVLCVALDAACGLAREPLKPTTEYVDFRTVLIPPNTMHHLRVSASDRMAFLYIDGLSEDYARLQSAMNDKTERFSRGLPNENKWIDVMRRAAEGETWRTSTAALATLLGARSQLLRDPRIEATLARQRMSPSDSHSSKEAAAEAGLSQSRFLHLFKEETGLPYRRYRLWIRIGAALSVMRRGGTLTQAAYAAGFSSSAHFTTAFTTMFGMPPSRLDHLLKAPKHD